MEIKRYPILCDRSYDLVTDGEGSSINGQRFHSKPGAGWGTELRITLSRLQDNTPCLNTHVNIKKKTPPPTKCAHSVGSVFLTSQ